MKFENYYLGLDVGTDSAGYAVTNEEYVLLKHGGEPMWGSQVFEAAKQAGERRVFRTARRRKNRKKQRVALINEIFASEIAKVDERFFIRRRESALFREDVNETDRYIVFNENDFTDREFYGQYPTIHHLIVELMRSKETHDVRLVYLACAYLVAHRGHFLSDVNKNNIKEVLNFDRVYHEFENNYEQLYGEKPWNCELEQFQTILKKQFVVSEKEKEFLKLLNNGKKLKTENKNMSREGIIKLLSGGTYDLQKLFPGLELEEKISVCFKKTEEDFLQALSFLDEEAELMIALRNVYDWATLADVLKGKNSISEGKIQIYEQHKRDLKWLKTFIKKYLPDTYEELFRSADKKDNYVAYSLNVKSIEKETVQKANVRKASKEAFCDYVRKLLKDISVEAEDKDAYDDAMLRLSLYTFMPKQVEGDNRVIPYQLYYDELRIILENASSYLPFLLQADKDGYVNKDKILSIMEFRIPYYVGPLRRDNSMHAWIERKAEGKIYPWNFEEKVDLDKSEQAFIERMTNTCTYVSGENVLPKNSLLYCKFTILNEINTIGVNNVEIPVWAKHGIFELFKKQKKVTVKQVKGYLESNNLFHKGDNLTGIDVELSSLKSNFKPYHDFKRLLENGTLSEKQIESVIEHLTYSEDRKRIVRWLRREFSQLSEEDVTYISKLKYQDFGRISRKFLTGIEGCSKKTGEVFTIIEAMEQTNDNLMQILSEQYTFKEVLNELQEDYYKEHPASVEQLLDEMYISNAVKRPIYRTLDIINDVKKICRRAPKRIFIEMARGGGEKNGRTKTRRDKILELYKNMDKQEVRELSKQLEEKTDNELQSEVLFLYFIQLGKCAYSGVTLDIDKLKTKAYDVDHIYPQSKVKDDSLDNKVLVLSTENGRKKDGIVLSDVREKMTSFWKLLKKNGLMSEEKYKRLTRNKEFSEEELKGFINRQLVETRQSTKALTVILKQMFPDTEIIYSKAGLVSDFRHEFGLLKTRSVNDLHHAKDAYLNIVVGNVYYCRFTKNFYIGQKYSLKTKTIFTHAVMEGKKEVWSGEKSIQKVKKVMDKNNIHYTRYTFKRKGGLFDQMPVKASEGLIPRKAALDTQKYGGYNKTAATGFILTAYKDKGKKEIMIMPIELLAASLLADAEALRGYAKENIAKIWGRKEDEITEIEFPLGSRVLKVNTMLAFDGFRACITGKTSGGRQMGLTSMMPLIVGNRWEQYVKKIDRFIEKKQKNEHLTLDEKQDGIMRNKNIELYQFLVQKIEIGPYHIPFSAQIDVLKEGATKFEKLSLEEQIKVLQSIILLLKSGRAGTCDLSLLGGKKAAGAYIFSTKVSAWKKKFHAVHIIDTSASGIFEKKSQNLLEMI